MKTRLQTSHELIECDLKKRKNSNTHSKKESDDECTSSDESFDDDQENITDRKKLKYTFECTDEKIHKTYWIKKFKDSYLFYTLFSFITLFALYVFLNTNAHINVTETQNEKEINLKDVRFNVIEEIKNLKQKLNQPKDLWYQFISLVDEVTYSDPPRPAVMLLLVPKEAKLTAVCVVHRFMNAVANGFGDPRSVVFNSSNEVSSPSDLPKAVYSLRETLGKLETLHGATVEGVEKLASKEAAFAFHAFCDTDNAPHKRAIIIATLNVPSGTAVSGIDGLRTERLAYSLLREVWRDMRQEDFDAVMSRVAVRTHVLKGEKEEVIHTTCPSLS